MGFWTDSLTGWLHSGSTKYSLIICQLGKVESFDLIIRYQKRESQVATGFFGSERKFTIEVQGAVPRPWSISKSNTVGDPLPAEAPVLVGIDDLISQLQTHLAHMSSVLLSGALGSGKSSVSRLLADRLRSEMLFHTTYFSCRKLVTDETRVSTIKETFTRVFMSASWGARLGGKSLVIYWMIWISCVLWRQS